MKHACPHCGKEINPAKMLGAIRTPKKEAAWKANGERLKKMYANARKVGESTFGGAARKDELGARDSGKEPMRDPEQSVSIPAPTTISAGLIAPKGSVSIADLRAVCAGTTLTKGSNWSESEAGDLQNQPHAPFDLNIEGEPHRVSQLGRKGLYLFHVGEDGLKPLRPLAEGELEKLWEKRMQ